MTEGAFERCFLIYAAHVRGLAAALGLDVGVRRDPEGWVAATAAGGQMAHVNPTLDPEQSHVRPDNSFWIRMADEDGRVVAAQATRAFEVEDLEALIRSNRIWWERGKVPPVEVTLCLPPLARDIRGRVAYGGGCWVLPDFRGNHLGQHCADLAKLCAVRLLEADWMIAFAKHESYERSKGRRTYLSAYNVMPAMTGLYPPMGQELEMDLGYLSRADIAAFAEDCAARCRLPVEGAASDSG